MNIITAFGVIVLIDLVSGIVHWAEDTFASESTPIIGKWIVVPNVIHHKNATAFVSNSWTESSWDLLVVGIVVVLMGWAYGFLIWYVWLFVLLGVNANQIHKWNHMRIAEVPALIHALQWLRLIQRPTDHAAHHRGQKNRAYCLITPFLNPVLDRVGFWRALEKVTVPIFTAPRREDLKNNA